jgi:hypothetical protein
LLGSLSNGDVCEQKGVTKPFVDRGHVSALAVREHHSQLSGCGAYRQLRCAITCWSTCDAVGKEHETQLFVDDVTVLIRRSTAAGDGLGRVSGEGYGPHD